ncbi:hypothetical protein B296_00014828 [Ensete ventricosum]|uniref:Transmembrane protein n=1 Tax=Ensete ventricosum TaxID=4639 RepID=A0A426YNV6_ENSVE|nr:hypothetical protein B296_00014828 [Ensete ventricosum]
MMPSSSDLSLPPFLYLSKGGLCQTPTSSTSPPRTSSSTSPPVSPLVSSSRVTSKDVIIDLATCVFACFFILSFAGTYMKKKKKKKKMLLILVYMHGDDFVIGSPFYSIYYEFVVHSLVVDMLAD